jgi:hypothetical protein
MSVIVNRSLLAYLLQQGEPVAKAVNRGVGKTTGAILRALGESYTRPGEWVNVDDPDQDTEMTRDWLKSQVLHVSHSLRMQGIEVRQARHTAKAHVQLRNTFAERLA